MCLNRNNDVMNRLTILIGDAELTRYIDQEAFIVEKGLWLSRRISKLLSKDDPEYVNGYWTDDITGDVYTINLTTNEVKQIFKATR